MNDWQNILREEVQHFINDHISCDIKSLALKKNPFSELRWSDILTQIQSKQKAKNKLPSWYNIPNILYPLPVSIEQTSSEWLSLHKSQSISGKSIIDITGGFGADAYYFAKSFEKVVHCEWDKTLSDMVTHNFKMMNIKNIQTISGDGLEILRKLNSKWDWIYIDPARRDQDKKKVFLLEDCLPNVVDLKEEYFRYSHQILIKTAPLLDLMSGYHALKNVKKIEIVSLENDVKEILWYLEKDYSGDPKVCATVIQKNQQKILFETSLTDDPDFISGEVGHYLYEPFHALLKTGNFNRIGAAFGLRKLHKHSHLYTSNVLTDFPGRRFKVEGIFLFQKKEIKLHLQGKQANISVRNFPLKTEEIKKKYKIEDGGEQYIFFTTDHLNRKIFIRTQKV